MSTTTRKPRTPSTPASQKLRKSGPIAAAEAKTHLLRLIEEVSRDRVPVTISKRGKALVQLVPLDEAPGGDPFGCMKGTVKILGDIIGPEPDRWEAME
jgi:prevent-host-death family protein